MRTGFCLLLPLPQYQIRSDKFWDITRDRERLFLRGQIHPHLTGVRGSMNDGGGAHESPAVGGLQNTHTHTHTPLKNALWHERGGREDMIAIWEF